MNRLFQIKESILLRIAAPVAAKLTLRKLSLSFCLLFFSFAGQCGTSNIIEISAFEAFLKDHKIELKWVVGSEYPISHFVIEKSFDGKTYIDFAVVSSKTSLDANINYGFSDDNSDARSSALFYRIRLVTPDGNSKHSDIRVIQMREEKSNGLKITVFPNPAVNNLSVTIPKDWQNKTVKVELYNSLGFLMRLSVISHASQTETITLNTLPKDFYIVRASCEDEVAQEKIRRN
ncbi:MAG TPA: T9SS type A sorting domain-containing protein [Flavisolibacter sp.]|nr:T9SS type A sorting domain-containing protein [Flavisolibacter sp.]